ncbi:MAG: c-type cytochrome [Verrucomicrobiae bacterium]|nr:c-type cytochrome [Verrucomicrobiae bacterium]
MMTINCRASVRALPSFLFTLLMATSVGAQSPNWIWHPNEGRAAADKEVRFFRKVFSVERRVQKAILSVAADNRAEVFVNGERSLESRSHSQATHTDVTAKITAGANVIAVRAANEGGPAALLAELALTLPDGQQQVVVTDASWLAGNTETAGWRTTQFQPSADWAAAVVIGKLGDPPWGDPLKPLVATPAESLTVLPGFQVQLLHSAAPQEGSWICMTVDDKGRLIISPQRDDQPLLRVTLGPNGQVEKIEPIPAPVQQAMGLCYAHDSLYVNGHGPNGTGLYRLIDENRNDQFDANEVRFLKKFQGEGEHGYHAVVEGPDGMIYVMNGNHTKVPAGVSPDSPHRNYDEDLLLPRQWDAGGHAVGILAPGGYIVRTDRDGKKWELMLAGFRNSYDFDFNADGEIFTFDSDMEWDWGMPWYRPTRINHCISGGEYGWRSGTGKWPEYYPDSLPATVNIGIGSPTGVKFGTKGNYPDKYRKALFAMDWSYGRILAVHLQPHGASYTGTYESFVKGKPLNVSDLEFGEDGAMYFITGGRRTQSGLYRVSHVGPASHLSPTPNDRVQEESAAKARELRRKLEASQAKSDPRAIDFAWPHLSSSDRFIRYAARIAIEHQDVNLWKDRALAETNPDAGLTALLALARCGGRETQNALLAALKNFPLSSLTEEQKLAKLRVIALSFIRQGRPSPEMTALAIEKLNAVYPAPTEALNRELSQLLIYLGAPDVISKTLALLEKAPTIEEQAHYIFHLRNVKSGWTLEQRRKYFTWFAHARASGKPERHSPELVQWFKEVERDYSDGASYPKFLVNIRKDALATLTSAERTALQPLIEENLNTPPWKPTRERTFVKDWTVDELAPSLDQVGSGRDFLSGKNAFNDTQCILCHRFGNEGGSVGPELTGVSSKYSRRDLLESLLEPSKVVSDQYQNYMIVKTDGDDVAGRVTDENAERIIVLPNMLAPETTVEVRLADIARREPSTVSPMPSGLLNSLTREEILDLLAYLEAAGKPNAANFRK